VVIDAQCRRLEIDKSRVRPLVQLASDNSYLIGSVDPDFHVIAVGPDDSDLNPVTDVNCLAALSAEYQHDISSLKRTL
jgi:hypothetical protein